MHKHPLQEKNKSRAQRGSAILKIERELNKSQKIIHDYQHALDQSSIVAITDAKGEIIFANEKFCQISKYSKEELIGQNHRMINSGHHPKQFFVDLWRTISRGKVWRGEIKNKAKDGSLYWVDTTIVPFLGEDGRPEQYVAIRNDITEKMTTQEFLETERARTLHAEKMASLGEMAAGIAHELGNPLASVASWFDVVISQIEDGRFDPDKIGQTVPAAKEKIERMKRIIRGMLSYARDGSSDPFQQTNMYKVIRDVFEYSAHRFKKLGIDAQYTVPEKHCGIECRETEISQVLVNLIANACDAVRNQNERWIRIHLEPKPGGIEITVTDSGPGIKGDIRDKIMNPFFTTKLKGKGTGLGLSISKSIIERHHGTLSLSSTSKNTRFVIFLPRLHTFD
jgi:PAS domain S-box-containing protein